MYQTPSVLENCDRKSFAVRFQLCYIIAELRSNRRLWQLRPQHIVARTSIADRRLLHQTWHAPSVLRAALPPLELESIVFIVTRSAEILNMNLMRNLADESPPIFMFDNAFVPMVLKDLGELGAAHTECIMLLRLLGST